MYIYWEAIRLMPPTPSDIFCNAFSLCVLRRRKFTLEAYAAVGVHTSPLLMNLVLSLSPAAPNYPEVSMRQPIWVKLLLSE